MEVIEGLLGVLLLSIFVASTASQPVTEYYAGIGDSFTLPLDYKPLNKDDELIWKHGDTVILRRKRNAFSRGKKEDIDAAGSLTLKDLKPQNAGVYTAEVYDNNGHNLKEWTGKLTILEKVKKPTVKFDCPTGKSTSVSFTCVVPSSQGLTFSWTLNGKDLGGRTDAALSLPLSDLRGNGSVTCTVTNPVSADSSRAARPTCTEDCLDCFTLGPKPQVTVTCTSTQVFLTCEPPWSGEWSFAWTRNGNLLPENKTARLMQPHSQVTNTFSCSVNNGTRTETSDETKPTCPATSGSSVPSLLFGFDFWPMVAILAAGGGFLLLLLIVTPLVCYCKAARRRNEKVPANDY